MRMPANVVLIVNPAAHNGAAAQAAPRVERALAKLDCVSQLKVERTAAPGHAARLVRENAASDAVVLFGGDGLVHEAVGGLMELSEAHRPALGLVPFGSGNDFAATLGMSCDPDTAVAQLGKARARRIDAGVCNGEPFAETLSFGLDAAIALDTVERRRRTGKSGAALYAASGFEQLAHHRVARAFSIALDGQEPRRTAAYLMAVQNGPTYGGGFRICPEADPADGALDVCMVHPELGFLGGLFTFLSAKNAHHTKNSHVEFGRASRLVIEFDDEPPCQLDGERCSGRTFEIEVLPRALEVLSAL